MYQVADIKTVIVLLMVFTVTFTHVSVLVKLVEGPSHKRVYGAFATLVSGLTCLTFVMFFAKFMH